jgi:U-box domain
MGNSFTPESTPAPPEHMLCPLTLEIMSFPFQDCVTGHCFEKSAILDWLEVGNGLCPLTRSPLSVAHFSTNHDLMSEIYEWKKKHGLLKEAGSDEKETQTNNDKTDFAPKTRRYEWFQKRELAMKDDPLPPPPTVPDFLQLYV